MIVNKTRVTLLRSKLCCETSNMNAFGGMFATAAGYHHQDPYSRMMVGDAAMGVHAAAAAHHAHAMHHHQVRIKF